MKRIILLFLLLAGINFSLFSQEITLSDEAEISIMTCGSSDLVYAIYGHTAVRVNDPTQQLDVIFNYGVFSFNAPNFVYRFAKGQTDYMLVPERYRSFYDGYIRDGRSIKEQVLNLNHAEKQAIIDFLIENAKPENREYRYNFFDDNCATRVRDLIENQVQGKIEFSAEGEGRTFRQQADAYQRILPWTNFGINLVLGSPSDRTATAYDEMFLPEHLFSQLEKATVVNGDDRRPLVKGSNLIYDVPQVEVSWLLLHVHELELFVLFVLVFAITLRQLKKGTIRYGIDYLLLFIHGLIGLILLWFFLYSEHPAMKANYNQLWAVCLNLPFLFLWMVKSWRPVLRWYWVVLSAWLLLFFPLSVFLPQEFESGFYLLIGMLLIRSLVHSRFVFCKE